jgi:transposase InsO family protein
MLLDKISTVHGYPLSIVSDRDSQFTSHFWQQLMKHLQIELQMATSYHYQTNGTTKYHIYTIRQCIHNYTHWSRTKYLHQLSLWQSALNAAPGNSIGSSPFKSINSQNVRLLPSVRIYQTNVSLLMNISQAGSRFSNCPTKYWSSPAHARPEFAEITSSHHHYLFVNRTLSLFTPPQTSKPLVKRSRLHNHRLDHF